VSTKSDDLEKAVSNIVKTGSFLPNLIPTWMEDIGIKPASLITKSERIGSKNTKNKTDILIEFKGCPALKISAKLSNAGYYGNWYSHQRILSEFDRELFNRLTSKTTEWANNWIENPRSKLFVGVSVSFGERTGNTFIDFSDIFENAEDIKTIICGSGSEENAANCLYVSDDYPSSMEDLIEKLSPIDLRKLEELTKKIKVIFRPINPLSEGSNRGKNTYTKFLPSQKLTEIKHIKNIEELSKLGRFETVYPNGLTHNDILNTLQADFNILIARKIDTKRNWKFYKELEVSPREQDSNL
jgi:hypothetical protein